MPHSPLIQKWSRGCCCLATRPNFRRSSAFRFACGKRLLRAIQSRHRRFRRACEGDAARSMISMCCASELKRLSAVIQWISRVFSRVRFYIFEGRFSSGRKAVRQTPCRIHSGRQSRPHFLAFWPHLLVFLRISVGKRQCVKHAYICRIGVSAIRKIPQTGGFFACLRAFPVCQVYTQKNQYLCNQGGSVCIRWTMGGFTMNPQCELYKRKIYRKTEKEQQRGCPFLRCAANHFPSAPTRISRSGFLFLLFLCPKKDFAKDIFWFDCQS